LKKSMTNSIFSIEGRVDERSSGGLNLRYNEKDAEEDGMDKYTIAMIMGLMSAGLNLEASAGQILEQAPIIFEYNLTGPSVIETSPITASGIIKTISISSEYRGEINLEASANGGNSYVKIINGVPIADGFIPGNQLRVKANIEKGSVLKNIVISYTDSSGASRSYQNPDLKNYKYKESIYITGGSQEVYNYPLRVNLGSGGLNLRYPDNSNPDIYFTAADGQTPLYYYKEIAASPAAPRNDTGDTAPRNDTPGVIANPPKANEAIFWVKVPQIPKEGIKIYMYYNVFANSAVSLRGRSEATDEAISKSKIASLTAFARNDTEGAAPRNGAYNDPNKVFPFFDDFAGTALNEEKWETVPSLVPSLKNKYSVQDGYLQLKDCLVLSRNFKIKEGILEFKAKADNNAGIQVLVRTRVSAQAVFPYEQIVYSSNYPGAEHTIAINDIAKINVSKPIQPLTYYMYKAMFNSTGILFERYSQDQEEKQAEIKLLDVGNFDEGKLGLKAETAAFNTGSVYFDWIRVRPYVEVEPIAKRLR